MRDPAKATGKIAATLGVAAALAACPLPAMMSTSAQDATKVAAPTKDKMEPAPEKTVVEAKKEVRLEAVGKMVRVPGGQVVPLFNPAQQARQVIQQLRTTFRAELRLMTSAANPSPALRTEVAVEAGKAVRELAAKLAGNRNAANGVVINRLNSPALDPHKQVRDAVLAAAREKLSPEQFDRYGEELKRKAEIRREAAVLNLVANIDRLLSLDPTQRNLLAEQFQAHWDERDYPTLEQSIIYDAYFPSIPDPHILPILSAPQREIWRAARKINFSALRTSNVVNTNPAVDANPDEEDPDVKAALDEEEKP